MKSDTKLINSGRDKKWTQGGVNPVIQRASTMIFENVAEMKHATRNRYERHTVLRKTWYNN